MIRYKVIPVYMIDGLNSFTKNKDRKLLHKKRHITINGKVVSFVNEIIESKNPIAINDINNRS